MRLYAVRAAAADHGDWSRERDLEILRLKAAGFSDTRIGERLGLVRFAVQERLRRMRAREEG